MMRAINWRCILFLVLWMNNPHLSYSEEIKRDAIVISGLKKTYSVDDRVMFIARNISSEKVFVNLRLVRNRDGRWVEIIPYIGASHATKTIRVERFLPNQKKSLAWNGSETGEVYKAKIGEHRLVATFYSTDPLTQRETTVFGHFEVVARK